MKLKHYSRPLYDYSGFRLSRLTEPRFRHILLLGGWLVYFLLYFLTENLIPESACHVIHGFLDDIIPFSEYWLIFYCSWYVVIFFSLLYYLLYDPKSFSALQVFIISTQLIAMAIYIIWPSRQDLRPQTFDHDNFFTWLMGIIYTFDTNTGVCPSLHVGYSLGFISCAFHDPRCPKRYRIFIVIMTVLISVSTTFVKQHSSLDVLAALPLGLAADQITYLLVYRKDAPLSKQFAS